MSRYGFICHQCRFYTDIFSDNNTIYCRPGVETECILPIITKIQYTGKCLQKRADSLVHSCNRPECSYFRLVRSNNIFIYQVSTFLQPMPIIVPIYRIDTISLIQLYQTNSGCDCPLRQEDFYTGMVQLIN